MSRLFLIVLLSGLLQDGGGHLLRCIQVLTGAADVEELDEAVVERYEALAAHPVRINGGPRGRLGELLTPYQLAALSDYRARFGDVLSAGELALVDGFGRERAEALAPFLSFASAASAGAVPDSNRVRHAAVLRGGVSAGRFAWGGKYRLTAGERWEVAAAARKSFTEGPAGTAYVSYQGVEGSLVLGDFHARFGQGAALWSGLYLDMAGSPSAFARRPAGITPAWSYAGTGCHRGLAGDWQRGRFQLSGFLSAPGWKERLEKGKGEVSADFGAHAQYCGLKGQGGLTFYHRQGGPSRLSVDGRWMLGRADLFGEAALDLRSGAPGAVGGVLLPLGENLLAGIRLRGLPTAYSGEKKGDYTLSAGLEYKDGIYVTRTGRSGFGASVQRNTLSCTLEGRLLPVPGVEIQRQLKGVLRWQSQIGPSWSLDLRLSERLRDFAPGNRTDLRGDAAWSDGRWTVKGRLNIVRSEAWGLLSYLECGREEEAWTVWLRGTLFRADRWNDRLYSYERDAPGSFNVPAYYGRGCALSCYGRWKFRWIGLWWKLYLRASVLSYPLMAEKKPGRAELKVQGAVDF